MQTWNSRQRYGFEIITPKNGRFNTSIANFAVLMALKSGPTPSGVLARARRINEVTTVEPVAFCFWAFDQR